MSLTCRGLTINFLLPYIIQFNTQFLFVNKKLQSIFKYTRLNIMANKKNYITTLK